MPQFFEATTITGVWEQGAWSPTIKVSTTSGQANKLGRPGRIRRRSTYGTSDQHCISSDSLETTTGGQGRAGQTKYNNMEILARRLRYPKVPTEQPHTWAPSPFRLRARAWGYVPSGSRPSIHVITYQDLSQHQRRAFMARSSGKPNPPIASSHLWIRHYKRAPKGDRFTFQLEWSSVLTLELGVHFLTWTVMNANMALLSFSKRNKYR